jgi:hypothetical protein
MSVYTGHFCRREKKMSKLNLSVHDNVPGNIVESDVVTTVTGNIC